MSAGFQLEASAQPTSVSGGLTWQADRYGGVATHTEGFSGADAAAAALFAGALRASFVEWRGARMRGVWLPIPASKAALIPVAVAAGFEFHHCLTGEQVGVFGDGDVLRWA